VRKCVLGGELETMGRRRRCVARGSGRGWGGWQREACDVSFASALVRGPCSGVRFRHPYRTS